MNEEEKKAANKRKRTKYYKTEKGKETIGNYQHSKKGREVHRKANAKYHKTKKGKEKVRRYNKDNRKVRNNHLREFRKTKHGKDLLKKRLTKYHKTEGGIKAQRMDASKRRSLGFIELNDHFQNSDAHHIDKEFVIYIPTEMHISVSHNVHTGKGMEEINTMAIDYCYGD